MCLRTESPSSPDSERKTYTTVTKRKGPTALSGKPDKRILHKSKVYCKIVYKCQKFDLGTSANVSRIKETLEKKELIGLVPGQVNFLDPVYELWFKKEILNQKLIPDQSGSEI